MLPRILQRIRAYPTEVRYHPQGIFELTCISNGSRVTLQANEKRPIKYLYENTYGTGLTKNWIAEVQNIGQIEINSTRDADNPLNWFVYEGFIAFFTTDDFHFIYVDDFIHLRCPDGALHCPTSPAARRGEAEIQVLHQI